MMLNTFTRTLAATAVALALPLSSAAAEPITLHEAISLARANAPEIFAAEARAEAASARVRQARSWRMPEVSLQEIWMRTDSPAEAFALQLNQERFSFPDFVSSDPNAPDAIDSATTRLQASVPIYTAGEISGRIQQAELASQAARESARWAGDQAVLAAAHAYIQLAQVREQVALLERALETVEAHVAVARAYSDEGMLVRSELLRAEVEQARIQDLLSAARGMAKVADSNLSFRLGIDSGDSWELAELPSPELDRQPLDHWLALSASRADLSAARHLLAAGEIEERVQRSGRLPKIGLVARRDLVDDTLFGSHGDSTAIMAVGRINLWTGGRYGAAAEAAAAEVAAGQREVDQFREGIELDVRNAYEQESSALERHATALHALEAAEEAERITSERFAQGVVKMIDVLDASTARREAQMRELVARADAHLSRFRLVVKAGMSPEDVVADPDASTGSANTPDEDNEE